MKVSEYTAAFDEKYAAADAERKQFLAEGRKRKQTTSKCRSGMMRLSFPWWKASPL